MLDRTLMCVTSDVTTGSVPVSDVIYNTLKCHSFRVPKTRGIYKSSERRNSAGL
jgi:hypothetical protein